MHKNQNHRSLGTRNKNILCHHGEYDINEDADDFVECDNCGKSFHFQCSQLSKRQFNGLGKNEEAYCCQSCKEEINIKN